MVYSMLAAAADAGDPTHFRETDLFKRCLAAGIIPASEEDLKDRIIVQESHRSKEPDSEKQTDLESPRLTVDLAVNGMWCPACGWVIEESLNRSTGIFSTRCHFAVDHLQCTYDPTRTSPSKIKKIIEKLGYGAGEAELEDKTAIHKAELIRLLISAFLGMNVMMLSFALYTGFFSELPVESIHLLSRLIFIPATIVVIYGGWPIFHKALTGIRSKSPGMEVLISMGVTSAYLYSVYNLLNGSIHLYFDTAAMLIVLTLVGKSIEGQARKKVRGSLDGLLSLLPGKVCLLTPEFPQGRYVNIAQLQTGNHFRVAADEILPADGIVLSGRAKVDKSALTGEARPETVTVGSFLRSGTRLITDSVIVEATAVGSAATLGQMITVIRESLYKKSPLENNTDRILRYFTPTILLLAISTGAYCMWAGHPLEIALVRAVTVMVIACPCALGIAVPMARVAGIALAGRSGILVREFDAFEQAGRIDTVVFDKTGTLTTGQWRLTRTECLSDYDGDFVLRLSAGLEENSDHLIAGEIRRKLTEKGLAPIAVEVPTIHPDGVSGCYRGSRYCLGSRRFVGMTTDLDMEKSRTSSDPAAGVSSVFLSRDGIVTAVLYFGDQLRVGAEKTVKNLMQRGLDICLVTGDDEIAARTVADLLGIMAVHANVQPLEKSALIDDFRQNSRKTAMIGDGINDAPALSRADLSAAMASSNTLANQAAQITLMGADPAQFSKFLDIAEQVTRKIHQNLWCALIYNLLSIPVAMAGWISPLVAVTAMLASSLTVVGNTYILTRIKFDGIS